MRRAFMFACSFMLISIAVSACGTSTSRLTSAEYVQLLTQQKAIAKAERRWPFSSLLAGCRTGGTATVLIKDARTACDAEAAETMAVVGFYGYRCGPGTAINDSPPISTPWNTRPVRRYEDELVCLNPGYRHLARTAAAEEAADLALRRELMARGLPDRCVTAIGQNRNALRTGLTFVTAIRKFAEDTALLSKVTAAHAPIRDVKISRIKADETSLKRTLNAYQNRHSILLDFGNKLSVCPHG